jgi:UDPglucose 6-dehydrogenase
LLGLSFKPETDDVRESPALVIVAGLLAGGARIRAYDPAAMEASRAYIPEAELLADPYEVATGADALLILTEWNIFKKLELDRLKTLLRQPLVIDLRNIYEPAKMAAAGFTYLSVGRDPGLPAAVAEG